MDGQLIQQLNTCLERLERERIALEDQLRSAESRAKGWNPATCNRLRERSAAVDRKMERCLNAIELEVAKP